MDKVLTQMVEQFKAQHEGKPPRGIVVAPVALADLGIKRSLKPSWDNIPVTCRLFEQTEVVKPGKGTRMGVFVYNDGGELSLRSCDLP